MAEKSFMLSWRRFCREKTVTPSKTAAEEHRECVTSFGTVQILLFMRAEHNLIGWDLASGLRLLWLVSMSICEGGTEWRPYHGGVFHQGHVVTAERHHEQHRPDILETTNPLPPLGSLASNIVHPTQREENDWFHISRFTNIRFRLPGTSCNHNIDAMHYHLTQLIQQTSLGLGFRVCFFLLTYRRLHIF